MSIIDDINEYARICLSPEVRIKPKYTCIIFDKFYTYFEDMYKKQGFSNMFIEKLIEIGYIKIKPPFIYSPWKRVNTSYKNKELLEGVYRNKNGHIYYDPYSIDVKTAEITNEFSIQIKLPDTIAALYLGNILDSTIKGILSEKKKI